MKFIKSSLPPLLIVLRVSEGSGAVGAQPPRSFADAQEDDREAGFWRTFLDPVGTLRLPTPERFPNLMTHIVRAQADVLEHAIVHFTKVLPLLPAAGPENSQVVEMED